MRKPARAATRPARRQRRHGSLPAGFAARQQADGSIRPRWIPEPNLRKAGWKGVDLKDADGQWLALGAAIDRAKLIAQAARDWRQGLALPEGADYLVGVAPGVSRAEVAAQVDARERIDVLETAWLESREFTSNAAATQRDYKNKLQRLFDALAGYAQLPARDDADGEARRLANLAKVRAMSIFALAPFENPGQDLVDPMYDAYWALHAAAGVNQAGGVLAVASVWLNWIHDRRNRAVANWAKSVSRETPPGRIRPATLVELRALVATGDAHGYEDVVDAVILAFDLSWSQIDVLQLTEDRVVDYRAFTGLEGRQKTGRVGGTPMTFIGRARYDAILERRKGEKIKPLKAQDRQVIRLKRDREYRRKSGVEADSHLLRKRFAALRELAMADCPSLETLTFADLRDTAVTFGRNAGLSDDQLASRTLQSRKNIADLHDKHYGEIGAEIADQGLVLLEAHYRKMGIAL
ncbi:hypothetical protein [Caulobacter sp. BK020]|uniref:hypothetical protein n=1 Tax=Caulobacter sp. BK020 TaxID=2512117 RepID=UPI0010462EE5|nr:hypothetical protein [Caulobacter sp. BK020]TCS14577.1 hypothetical protein EV278_107226 [Caulobacter sp. BK020]